MGWRVHCCSYFISRIPQSKATFITCSVNQGKDNSDLVWELLVVEVPLGSLHCSRSGGFLYNIASHIQIVAMVSMVPGTYWLLG